jgi:AraC family transcriptional regulator
MSLVHSSGNRVVSPVVRAMSTRNFCISERTYESYSESPLHRHVKNYLIVTLDGGYFSTFETRSEEFNPWSVSYHRAGAAHTSRYGTRGARVLYVELSTDRCHSFLGKSNAHLSHFSLRGGLLEWAARQLYSEFSSPDHFSPEVIDGLVMQMLAHLFRRRASTPQRMPAWLGNADVTIRNRFMEPLALGDIAQLVNIHPVHLAREYKRFFHCTIGEQIRRLRIEFACEQLSTTTNCLGDIALAAGFSDQSHFTSCFKQQLGTSPSHYRKGVKTRLLAQ